MARRLRAGASVAVPVSALVAALAALLAGWLVAGPSRAGATPGPVAACAHPAAARAVSADRTLWRDRCGRPFYVDRGATSTSADAVAAAAPYPYTDTFALHSRPGSSHVLYLDFHGATISGTAWNADPQLNGAAFVAPGFDADGQPGSFSTGEQDLIQSVWARVAEDYAPFDVDVTTADPGASAITRSSSTDPTFGTRVLITDATGPGSDCGCGGIAYLDVFAAAASHDYYQPAFVFWPAVSGAKAIAEAAAHEAGHTFGLRHDGTASSGYYEGQGAWAPIMGASYYHPVSQWSRGEYLGANNTEDDLAVIAAGGAPLVPDDHGNSAATATALDPTTLTATGLIGTATDTDWFSFTSAGGATTVDVEPAAIGPDLDVDLRVYRGDGSLLADVDPATSQVSADSAAGLGATFTDATLPAGSYFVVVDGGGNGDPASTGYSDYASLGRYTLTVATAAVAPPRVTDSPVTVTTPRLPGATLGAAYSARFTATGGTGPYTWRRAAGALPAGVVLQAGGALTGRPTATGIYSFTVAALDSAGHRGTLADRLVVAARPRVTTSALPLARRGHAYAASLSRAGGTAALHWSVSAGRLPSGVSLASSGALRGTPRFRGRWTFTLAVTDRWGAAGRRSFALSVR